MKDLHQWFFWQTPDLFLQLRTSFFLSCPTAAAGGHSEFCEKRRRFVLTFSLPRASAWVGITRRMQVRSAAGDTTNGAPHLPQSRWVTFLSFFSFSSFTPEVSLHSHVYTAVSRAGAADQKEACPFVIDWIPDVLPRCHVGELRISFEFGHQQSGQPEHGDKTSAAEKGGRNKSDCPQHKLTNTVEILQVVV